MAIRQSSCGILTLWIGLGTIVGCKTLSPAGSDPNPSAPPNPAPFTGPIPTVPTPSGSNVMAVSVNGDLCGSQQQQSPNHPCVAVTICSPGTSNCQTINNILLDTGSSGLRVFSSLVTISLPPVSTGSGTLAECVTYADKSSDWGAVAYADVTMGGEPAVHVPIQLINATFGAPPAVCSSPQTKPDLNPTQAGLNGILGVGLASQDCGTYCNANATNSPYYSCSATSCTNTATRVQVQNPVALLPKDNNGVILQLPTIPDGGAPAANGTLTFGIGTQANNTPSNVTTFAADSRGQFTTTFSAYSSRPLPSFIDSGSNELSLPAVSSVPPCGQSVPGIPADILCPTSTQSLSAVNTGAGNVGNAPVTFQVGNGAALIASNNFVFSNLAVANPSTIDWGLPFFFGRTVYVGLEGATSKLGSGMYWAY